MKYYGIKKPKSRYDEEYIWWIADSEHDAWNSFFSYPSKDKRSNGYRLPLSEAIRAYKSIGYECVELEITEKQVD
ncbi:MAG: hypothetical protein GY834_08310 [Bacteroidetes bacterium]|nr:hypothetical protein [Bacteroidota bacterium]